MFEAFSYLGDNYFLMESLTKYLWIADVWYEELFFLVCKNVNHFMLSNFCLIKLKLDSNSILLQVQSCRTWLCHITTGRRVWPENPIGAFPEADLVR